MRNRVCCAVVVVLAGSACSALAGEWPPALLRTVYSSRAFLDVQADEAHAAAAMMSDAIARHEGFDTHVDVVILDDVAEIEQLLHQGQADLVTLVSQDYLALEHTGLLEPAFVSVRNGEVLERAVMLVRVDSDFEQLAQLRGGRLMVSRSARQDLPLQWLESELIRQDLPSSGEMFVVESTRGPAQALTAVFFGKADVCIVLHSALKTAVELNPQLGEQLRVVGTSPAVLGSVICYHTGLHPETRAALQRALGALHTQPLGKQLLSVFRVQRLIPYEPQHMTETRRLLLVNDLVP